MGKENVLDHLPQFPHWGLGLASTALSVVQFITSPDPVDSVLHLNHVWNDWRMLTQPARNNILVASQLRSPMHH